MYFRNSPKVSWFSLRIIVTKLTRVQSSWKVDPPPLPSLTGLFSLGNYKPSVTCCTTKFTLDFFVPMTLVATHSYKPLSTGPKFLMVRLPWFTSVFPAGKGIPNLVHFTTGGGKPSAWHVCWKVEYCFGVTREEGTRVKTGRPKWSEQITKRKASRV